MVVKTLGTLREAARWADGFSYARRMHGLPPLEIRMNDHYQFEVINPGDNHVPGQRGFRLVRDILHGYVEVGVIDSLAVDCRCGEFLMRNRCTHMEYIDFISRTNK